MKNYQKILLALAVTTAGSTAISAYPGKGMGSDCNQRGPGAYKHQMEKRHMMRQKGDRILRVLRQLNLTEEQRDALWKENHKMREVMHNKRKAMRKEGGLNKYITTEKFDKSGFVAQAKKRANDKIQMRADRIEKLYNILTPAQKKRLVELINRPKGPKGQKGQRGPRGQGNRL